MKFLRNPSFLFALLGTFALLSLAACGSRDTHDMPGSYGTSGPDEWDLPPHATPSYYGG
ncbi:MAG: hypothetical protein AAF236_15805 [Verrucomicrobiota bacterium]